MLRPPSFVGRERELAALTAALARPPAVVLVEGRSHTFTITAQEGDPGTAATLASLRVWISPDGGKHWTEGHVAPKPDRTYQVSVVNPTLADSPTGTVALRAEAGDAAGNSLQQTIMDAYVLT